MGIFGGDGSHGGLRRCWALLMKVEIVTSSPHHPSQMNLLSKNTTTHIIGRIHDRTRAFFSRRLTWSGVCDVWPSARSNRIWTIEQISDVNSHVLWGLWRWCCVVVFYPVSFVYVSFSVMKSFSSVSLTETQLNQRVDVLQTTSPLLTLSLLRLVFLLTDRYKNLNSVLLWFRTLSSAEDTLRNVSMTIDVNRVWRC